MLTLRTSGTNRWAPSDGDARLAISTEESTLSVTVGEESAIANVSGGYAVLAADDLAALCPLGTTATLWGGVPVIVEHVGWRYCARADIEDYGRPSEDGFEDSGKYPVEAIQAAIQRAEEAIDAGTGRRFCPSAIVTRLDAGLVWLPVLDAESIETLTGNGTAELLSGGQAKTTARGTYRIGYGANLPASLREACIRLAASYLRPRTRAEDARGTSVDGVYTAYTLATGEDGSWTGLPSVDSAIAANRIERVVLL